MIQILDRVAPPDAIASYRDPCVKAYRFMLQARVLDEKLANLYRAGKIHGGVFLGRFRCPNRSGPTGQAAAGRARVRIGDIPPSGSI